MKNIIPAPNFQILNSESGLMLTELKRNKLHFHAFIRESISGKNSAERFRSEH